MKRFIIALCALAAAFTAFAQTPEEIVSRMEKIMEGHDNDGLIMTVDLKIPIIGTMTTRTWTLGDKDRIEAEMMGVKLITWSDGKTDWTYDSKKNVVEIKHADEKSSSNESGDASMFDGIVEGYDISIKKEDAKAWYLLCKKSKSNKDKDAPKSMDLVVEKGTFYPVSLTTKVEGMTLVMRDLAFGVTEKDVTFNIADYPGATIDDKRK